MEGDRERVLVEKRPSYWRRHRWLVWIAGGLLAGVVVLCAVVAVLAHRAEPYMRAQIVEGLQKRFHARVELDSFHIRFGNGLKGEWGVWAEGRGLRIWPAKFQQVEEALDSTVADEPMIRLEEFRFHAPLRLEQGKPLVISQVRIEGLDIDVPPRTHEKDSAATQAATAAEPNAGASSGNQSNENGSASDANQGKDQKKSPGLLSDLLVERVECDRARLVLETNKPGKLPMGFAIAHLVLTGITVDGPLGFEADLTNPRPLGQIHTTGNFGPWQADDPGGSAVSGDYRFDHADLSGFKGIAGILSSTGQYQGTLRDIVVDGETNTPDFKLTHFGFPMHLHTKFHARVDGTDGDTWLDPVDATLGQSHFTARGQVVRVQAAEEAEQPAKPSAGTRVDVAEKASPFRGGHDIAFTIDVDKARIEDFLKLTSRTGAPLLAGPVMVKAKLHIPPGPAPVHERMQLAGNFALQQVRFTSAKVQDRIQELSLRGQGRPKDMKTADPGDVNSTMVGDFKMAAAVITLPALTYTVPGATIDLKGTYAVEGGALNFTGSARLQATVSQIVGGWKGFLLKPADRFFKKGGAGTEVPIHIGGTRDDPTFGVEFDKRSKNSPENN